MWHNGRQCCHGWAEAGTYCDGLTLEDHDDWRLPTIDELRTLVRGCDAVAPDGSCEVHDDCLSSADCWDTSCNGCESGAGPGPYGHYWPADLGGEWPWTWTSSEAEDYEGYVWIIDFMSGYLNNAAVDSPTIGTRCVRES